MATVMSFDNINRLDSRPTYREYFSKMYITPEQKKRRVALADALEDELMFLFAIYLYAKRYGIEVDHENAKRQYRERLVELLRDEGIRESVIDTYMEDVVDEEIRVTAERYLDDEYWTSYDRAILISESDTNTILNNQEYGDAVESGKTKKQWLTMRDERVRATHAIVDGAEVPIDEPFIVGGYLMQYPHDSSLGADVSEIANCRCSVLYS